ncbi:MAG: glycosyltransferase [Sphingosinicella sp.]
MLRVLTLSTLFPSAARPRLGLFVERQARELATHPDVELEALAPVGLPAWPLSLHPHYAPLAQLPREESWNRLKVHRPRFRVRPGRVQAGAAAAMADALLPFLHCLRERFPFDVIDAQFFWPDGPAAMRLARALGLPFSVKARGADIHFWAHRPGIGDQVVAAGREAAGLLAVSAAMKADMVALGMPAEKIRVHHTGVDLDLFRPVDRQAARQQLGLEGPLLACAGALIPRKGQALAIEALAILPGATLLLVGDGPDRAKLQRLTHRLGMERRVRFLGSRPQSEVASLLAAADIAVQPSASEGLANVWVEAMACGTPVVTCDVGGANELFDRPEAGRLVARDSQAIAAALREMLADSPAPAAVRRTAERFRWLRNRDALYDHLQSIVSKESAARAA